jgi:hypothetical protein
MKRGGSRGISVSCRSYCTRPILHHEGQGDGMCSKETAMRTRRSGRMALAQLLVCGCAAVFGLIKPAQAQPTYVPPPTPLPPPVFNPSNPGTVPQPNYRPITPSPSAAPSTPNTIPTTEVRPPANGAQRSTTGQFDRTRTVHHHRVRFAGYTRPYYCGSSPCVRVVVAEPPPVYRPSVLWWPGYYDYAPGQFDHSRPRYGGYWRRAGYHGD